MDSKYKNIDEIINHTEKLKIIINKTIISCQK